MKKQKKASRIISNLFLILALGVFFFSAYKLYTIYSEYEKGDSEYEEIRESAIKIKIPSAKEKDKANDEPTYVVNFEKLKKMNPDVIGWIRFEEPSAISYPIVLGKDNKKYLNTTFEGNKNSAGTLFADYRGAKDFSDKNTFIYGHNMKNGAMFGQLRKYKDKGFCEENPFFYIYTPDGKELTYQIFAFSVVKDASESYNRTYHTVEEFQQYINHIKKVSRYTTDAQVDGTSQIVSLSTCTNAAEDERILLHAVKVSEK